MNIKYRILKQRYFRARDSYITQYRIFGIWMNININLKGQFFKTGTVHCNSYREAFERYERHKENWKRAGEILKPKPEIYNNISL